MLTSADDGKTWQKYSNESLAHFLVTKIVIDNKGAIYLGTSKGVFKSRNAGVDWVQINGGLVFDEYGETISIESFVVDKNNTIYLSTQKHIFKSVDGENWIQIGDFLRASIAVSGDGIVYLASTKAEHLYWDYYKYTTVFFKSSDGGLHWSQAGEITNAIVNQIAVDSTGVVYAVTNVGFYESLDLGESWKKKSVESGSQLIISQTGDFYTITGRAVRQSLDKGASWSLLGGFAGDSQTYSSALVASGGAVYLGTSKGVFKIAWLAGSPSIAKAWQG